MLLAMATRIDETVTVHASIAQAWEVLTNLTLLASCVPGAELISSPEPRSVLARFGSYNASARVADRNDVTYTLRLIGAARAAAGPSAAASLTLSLRPRSDGATTLEAEGDIELIDTTIKSIPTATIRAFVDRLRLRLEQPLPVPPAAPRVSVPSLATTGTMPAYKPPPVRPPTPARAATPIATPTVPPPSPTKRDKPDT
jgi:carbon monoxide dehydrogenase subunit G